MPRNPEGSIVFAEPRAATALAIVTLVTIAVVAPADADIATYAAELDGGSNVPPVGTPATGAVSLVVDTETREAFWVLEFTGLTSPEIGAHFHGGAEGVNGTAVFTIPLGSPVSGVWAMSPAHYGALASGGIYVNVHTENNPLGEIRGQLALVSTVPVGDVAFGATKALFR
jgi:hypothetical protein